MKVWHGCYDMSWKGIIPDSAFAHPAKFSKSLVERVLDYMEDKCWLEKGDTIVDPFAGVRLGGVIAAYRGYFWIGNELEERFSQLGDQVFAMHLHRWQRLGVPLPVCYQGDSRYFDEIIAGARVDAILSSPPYVSGGHHADVFDAWNVNSRGHRIKKESAGYGRSEGQIARLKEGTVASVVTSPPFLRAHGGERGIMVDGLKTKDGKVDRGFKNRQYRDCERNESNIESCPSGDVGVVLTSPPYETIATGAGGLNTRPSKKPGQQSGRRKDSPSQSADQRYGDTPGQIARLRKETYWEAMAAVYGACYRVLRPGGVMAIVVKDFVKNGKRQRLCDDTCRLLEHLGFYVIERVHAMLVQEWVSPDLFEGETVKRKTRKSFFRRNLERKLAPNDERRIDWEEVLFMGKTCAN